MSHVNTALFKVNAKLSQLAPVLDQDEALTL